MHRWRRLILLFTALFAVCLIAGGLYVWNQDQVVQERLSSGVFIPPWEIYSQGFPLSVGKAVDFAAIRNELGRNQWRERPLSQPLSGEDFKILSADDCENESDLSIKSETRQCLLLSDSHNTPILVGFDDNDTVTELWKGDPLQPTKSLGLLPKLVAQLAEGQPMLKRQTALGNIPLSCLQAVTAIEDSAFLEHSGVSPSGFLRAIYRNLRAGAWAEGGSTITQQLVKNYFLTPEKTIKRKLQEQVIAVLLEARAGKDFVLEKYLNIIYMGQNGPYQIRGFGSASEYYFDQNVSELNLAQCALLAAIVNNPGRYSPFDKAANAQRRRHLVLEKMLNLKMISESEMAAADRAPLPTRPSQERREPAPFYIASVVKELSPMNLPSQNGLRIYTSLDPEIQAAASRTLAQQIPQVEKRVKNPHKGPLQGAMISVDLYTSEVLAIVGGKDFRSTQFNRVVNARRQIGSVIKPFVFWPAMKLKGPLDPIQDEPFEWKLHGQTWSPRNYEGKPVGTIPLFWSLTQSLNMSTARLGQEIGLSPIINTLELAGLEEKPPELPSLTLGALELSPWQVAQLYNTLANFGLFEPLHTITHVEDGKGNTLYTYQPRRDQRLDAPSAATVVGMLKQTPRLGTAKSLKGLTSHYPVAGKTGTTSDTKDAWFVGFTPRLLTVVWVGFDDNTAMGLTGASAALPVWNSFFQEVASGIPQVDFAWPPQTVIRNYNMADVVKQYPALEKVKDLPENMDLVLPE